MHLEAPELFDMALGDGDVSDGDFKRANGKGHGRYVFRTLAGGTAKDKDKSKRRERHNKEEEGTYQDGSAEDGFEQDFVTYGSPRDAHAETGHTVQATAGLLSDDDAAAVSVELSESLPLAFTVAASSVEHAPALEQAMVGLLSDVDAAEVSVDLSESAVSLPRLDLEDKAKS